MPSTYTLISSNVLSSSAASVTFSAIPSTFTDLVLRISARNDAAFYVSSAVIKVNAITGTYSFTTLVGDGSAASSSRDSGSYQGFYLSGVNGNTATSNSFSSHEVYLPNYAGSANKVASLDNANETNATAAYRVVNAGLLGNTAAISTLTITTSSTNFLSGSSFYLYGIKNS